MNELKYEYTNKQLLKSFIVYAMGMFVFNTRRII